MRTLPSQRVLSARMSPPAHYKIIKSSDDETTMTDIQRLDMPGRVEEISRLLSGTRITEAARAQARELLGLGEEQLSFGK